MVKEDTFIISITLKNGYRFEHHHVKAPQAELFEFLGEIRGEMAKKRKGVLTLPSPFGIYQMDDISSIVFHLEKGAKTPPIGFHPSKPKD